MRLRHGCPKRTGRYSRNGRRLSAPRVLAMGPGAPIDRVLEQNRNGAVVLWCYEQQSIGRVAFRLELAGCLRHFAFKVIEGQTVERDEMEGQLFPCKLCDHLG